MVKSACVAALLVVTLMVAGLAKADDSSWLASGETLVADTGGTNAPAAQPDPVSTKAPPLPLHTIEGVGGGLLVPWAYLVNPGPEGTTVGMPSASFTYISSSGKKSIQAFAVTQTFFRRFEVGYGFSRFDLGSFRHAMKEAGVAINRNDVYLHNFNFRALLIEENSFGLPLPAITAGVHVKVNGGFRGIDNSVSNTFTGVGFKRSNGIDYTLTASKTIPGLILGRPVILNVGMRNSQASNIGYTGFSNQCSTTVEASAACLILDNLGLVYEFRQKSNPYDRIVAGGRHLLGDEGNWHAIALVWVVNNNLTIAGGWARLGEVVNSDIDGAWGVSIKYEF